MAKLGKGESMKICPRCKKEKIHLEDDICYICFDKTLNKSNMDTEVQRVLSKQDKKKRIF